VIPPPYPCSSRSRSKIRFEVCCCFAGRLLSSSRIRSMIPTNGSSFGRAGGRLRRYPGGTENASIFATVRGSIPKRRAASRRLSPSTYTARRTCAYSSTRFIPPPTSAAPRQMGYCCRIFTPAQPVYPIATEGFCLRCSHLSKHLPGRSIGEFHLRETWGGPDQDDPRASIEVVKRHIEGLKAAILEE